MEDRAPRPTRILPPFTTDTELTRSLRCLWYVYEAVRARIWLNFDCIYTENSFSPREEQRRRAERVRSITLRAELLLMQLCETRGDLTRDTRDILCIME